MEKMQMYTSYMSGRMDGWRFGERREYSELGQLPPVDGVGNVGGVHTSITVGAVMLHHCS